MRQVAGKVELFVSDYPGDYNTLIEAVGNRCLILTNGDDTVVVVLTDTDAQVLMEVLEDPDRVRGRHIQYGNLVIRHIDSGSWVGLSIAVDEVCTYIGSKYIPQLHALLADDGNVTTHDYR
jgi:hypothetical protein